MIDSYPALFAVSQYAKCHATRPLAASLCNIRRQMNGDDILYPVAEPPRAFGGQIILQEPSSQRFRQVVREAWEMRQHPCLAPAAETRNGEPQSLPQTSLAPRTRVPENRILA